jgi:hypothetical protein
MKGAVGEREFRHLLVESGWIEAARGQQRSGLEQADVVGGPSTLHFEVKRVEALNLRTAMRQAVRDAGEARHPVVVHRRNGDTRWLATLDARVLLRMVSLLEMFGLDFPPGETIR